MLKPGDTFERYTVEDAIGQGGMGRVYRALDARLGRYVALKVISEGNTEGPGKEASARLLREARAAAALDHPNAVSIFDVGEHEGAPYIVMELVSGSTLRGPIEAGDAPLTSRISWLTDAARALAAAHRRGIVHRDIKPENVMVRDDGVVKVLDFGIARRSGANVDPTASTQKPALPTLTVEGVKLGTPVYMAPEQIRGEALDGRTDQFAWGVLAYELLTGRLPWRGASDAFAVVASILTDEAESAALDEASVPVEVQGVVLRALSKRPEDRYPSMDDVVRALDAIAKGEAPPDVRSAPPPRARPSKGSSAKPSASATEAQRFSTEEVQRVLASAIDKQASKRPDAKLGYADLLAAAKEVDLDEESLREASRALRVRDGEPRMQEFSAWYRRRKVELYRHAGVYVIVNVALLILGFLLVPAYAHFLFVLVLLWGIGLAIHGLVTFTSDEQDWNEERQGMQWWQEQMRRRHEVAMAHAARMGVGAPPMPWGRAGRGRGAAMPERVTSDEAEATSDWAARPDQSEKQGAAARPERVRVRAAEMTDTARDQAAEDEALAEAEDAKRSKRRKR